MITVPTVLVLGAGASIPYGFPSGVELQRFILTQLKNNVWHRELERLDFEVPFIQEFTKALSFSGKLSIDAFLEHRREFIDLGKAAIALSLMPYEKESLLFQNESKNRNWYVYLFNKMGATYEQFWDNKLSIITFNYDRSLEQFLFTVIINSYGKEKEIQEVSDKLKAFPIIHVHGKLGDLQWQAGSQNEFKAYDGTYARRYIRQAIKKIKIVSDDIENDPEFKKAQQLLRNAANIYFLGFGYLDVNVKRLKIPERNGINSLSFLGLTPVKILGTAYGLGETEREDVISKWSISLVNQNYDVLDFFRRGVLLQ